MNWEPGKRYRITYSSESGETSERTIDVLGTSRAYGDRFYIRAFCNLRGEERTFRTDRIISSEPAAGLPRAYPASAPVTARLVTNYASEPASKLFSKPASQAAAYAEFCPTTVRTSPAPRAHRGGGAAVLVLVLGAGAGLFAYFQESTGYTRVPSGTAFTSTPPAAVQPAPKPSPPPKPALEEVTFGGYLLRTVRSGGKERFEVPELGIVTGNKAEAVSAIRLPRFVKAMGFFDPDLAGRYLDADLNGSGRLSFDELKVFQERTYRNFRYEANEPALRPDEFMTAGGGDCEDFALYTAGLLRYWGWEPYIGLLAGSEYEIGHVVCLSYEEGSFPDGFTYFDIKAWTTEDGSPLRPGTYVPIDYSHVGSLSNAVKKGWKLRSIYTPEKAWGLDM